MEVETRLFLERVAERVERRITRLEGWALGLLLVVTGSIAVLIFEAGHVTEAPVPGLLLAIHVVGFGVLYLMLFQVLRSGWTPTGRRASPVPEEGPEHHLLGSLRTGVAEPRELLQGARELTGQQLHEVEAEELAWQLARDLRALKRKRVWMDAATWTLKLGVVLVALELALAAYGTA